MIKLHSHQFWIDGEKNIHANCGTKVYGDDQGNRYCVNKKCMGSHHDFGINAMTDLVTMAVHETKYKFIPTKTLDLKKLEKIGIVTNITTI